MFELNLSEIEALKNEPEAKAIEHRVSQLEENSRYIVEAINSINYSLASVASSVALLAKQLNSKGGEI
ncbi:MULTISPECIES: hypothetical protein [unclassified Prosthecochloris]|uniref:hypothetical protein n=1 Tax=unclassified Prosthecochloris TaxID=2632826 RepID=UPI00223D5FD0|nr:MULTISPECIES: hypothetical protein [unclassified Prosthecochloris]UZJ39172.1 hypothetical protein OO185_04360 [Prosthecochloris sp. SCSIO W1102]